MERFLTLRNGVIASVIVLIVSIIFGSATQVKEQELVVLTTWGKFSGVRYPGLNFKFPFVQGFTRYSTTIQSFDVDKVNTYTVDNQELDAQFTVVYRIPASSVEKIFRSVPDYQERLKTLAVDRFKAEIGKINVTEIAQKRGPVRDKVLETMQHDASELYGLEIVPDTEH